MRSLPTLKFYKREIRMLKHVTLQTNKKPLVNRYNYILFFCIDLLDFSLRHRLKNPTVERTTAILFTTELFINQFGVCSLRLRFIGFFLYTLTKTAHTKSITTSQLMTNTRNIPN